MGSIGAVETKKNFKSANVLELLVYRTLLFMKRIRQKRNKRQGLNLQNIFSECSKKLFAHRIFAKEYFVLHFFANVCFCVAVIREFRAGFCDVNHLSLAWSFWQIGLIDFKSLNQR